MRKLFLIFTVGLIFRFYTLGTNPPSINWDEASNGYNAFSILHTGRDEYGNLLPLYNRSFDDYKPPMYMYLNVFSVKAFGLNEFATRFPSALLGTLLILIFYLMVAKLFSSTKLKLTATFLLAVSSWNINFSRVGFESNLGLFFTLTAFTSLLYALPNVGERINKSKILALVIASIFFGLTFYTYHSARIFTPILFLVLAFIYKKHLFCIPIRYLVLFFAITLLLIMPFFVRAPGEALSQRFDVVSLGAQKESTDNFIRFVQQDDNSYIARQIHNRKVLITINYLENYLSHFSIEFLFVSGDGNLRHHTEGSGMFPLFFLPLALIGLYKLFETHDKKSMFILSWLLIAPLPAAPADAAPHAVRSIFMSIPIIILTAVGIIKVMEYKKLKIISVVVLSIATGFYLYSYLHNYYLHYPRDKSDFWMYGFKEAVSQATKLQNNYQVINVDESIEQAYIFWLFYKKYDPATYQNNVNKPNIENFSFNDNKVAEGELFISLADHFNPDLQLIETIYYPNGDEAIKIGRKKYLWEM